MSRYTMGPCPMCDSSDAFASYDDGVGTCFSCGESKKLNGSEPAAERPEPMLTDLSEIQGCKSYPISSRGISQAVVDHFNIKMGVDSDGKPESHFYPYTKDGQITAYKERKLPKDFRIHGDFKGIQLFGQAQSQGGKLLVITEGELDACSVAEAYQSHYGRIYSVVSIPSASGTAVLLENRSWINQFETVVLAFDQDEAGRKAVDAAAKIIGAGKTKIASLTAKDPNAMLLQDGPKALMQAIWNAQTWNPAGILTGDQIWDKFLEREETESVPYPNCLAGLNQKLGGMRQGEITLFTSGTGSGKSTVIKEIVMDLLNKTEDKIGMISLEESVGETVEKFISMELKRPISDPPPLSDEDKKKAFDNVFGDERLVLLDHQGSVSDASLIDKIEYMALMGCKYLILDHITIAVSEGAEGLTGNEAIDKIMSDLLKICKRHNIWLGLISHLRKAFGGKSFEEGNLASIDDIKGSGSIKQISFDIIAFARNLVAEDELERNTVKFRVLKSRFTGRTGDAGAAIYDPKTTRLTATSDMEVDFEGL